MTKEKQTETHHYLWELRPYFRQVAGAVILGSLAGILMNTAVVLPALLLGHAIDTALALQRGAATAFAPSGHLSLPLAVRGEVQDRQLAV